jgi:hypothetical protein
MHEARVRRGLSRYMARRGSGLELSLGGRYSLELCGRLQPSHISRRKPLIQASRHENALFRLSGIMGKNGMTCWFEEVITLEHGFAAVDVHGLTSYETRLI